MDLVQTVRKEGSRGGRDAFKWEDVKTSVHRENYLGHSLMAPVGRWQKNKDLSWYAKADGSGEQMSEADARKEELKRVKRAEEEAMAKALGYELPDENANMTALGDRPAASSAETIAPPQNAQLMERKERRHRDERDRHRRRERSPDDRERRKHRRHTSREHRHRRRSRSRSRSIAESRSRSRSRSPQRRRHRSRDRVRDERRGHREDERSRRYSDRGARRSRSPEGSRRY